MKWLLVVGGTILFCFGVHTILERIQAGVVGNSIVVRSFQVPEVAACLAGYMDRHGQYPVGMDVSVLERAFEGQIKLRQRDSWRYYSDGRTYSLFLRLSPSGPFGTETLGVCEHRDGQWVAWPNLLDEPLP